jgi:hypothetical protein
LRDEDLPAKIGRLPDQAGVQFCRGDGPTVEELEDRQARRAIARQQSRYRADPVLPSELREGDLRLKSIAAIPGMCEVLLYQVWSA